MKPEKKRVDYRECPYLLVRYCSFKEFSLDTRPCERCIASKQENHLFKIKNILSELVDLYKKSSSQIK